MSQKEQTQDRVIIFDTTMRDGEQSPGASMTLDEKLEIARLLEEMGVDVIEAGFAIASNGDFEAINEIAKVVKNSVVCSLARSGAADIDRARSAEHTSELQSRRNLVCRLLPEKKKTTTLS